MNYSDQNKWCSAGLHVKKSPYKIEPFSLANVDLCLKLHMFYMVTINMIYKCLINGKHAIRYERKFNGSNA